MLRKVNLELTVLDYDRIGGSDAIGKVLLVIFLNYNFISRKIWKKIMFFCLFF